VAANITVRGRRLDPVSVSSIRNLMAAGDISMKDLLKEESKVDDRDP